MATVSQLTECVARHTGHARSGVTQIARRLREDRLLPTSSPAAPRPVSSINVANLILATMTTDGGGYAGATANAERYGSLKSTTDFHSLLSHIVGIIETEHDFELGSMRLDLMAGTAMCIDGYQFIHFGEPSIGTVAARIAILPYGIMRAITTDLKLDRRQFRRAV